MIRTAVESDIDRLKDNLRDEDAAEVMASHGQSPEQALRHSYHISRYCLTVLHCGRPVAMFGVVPVADKQATVWLLGTNELRCMWVTFLKLSQGFIAWMLDLYPTLYNYVDARNQTSIKWLIWCGAYFSEPEIYGYERRLFRLFLLKRNKPHV